MVEMADADSITIIQAPSDGCLLIFLTFVYYFSRKCGNKWSFENLACKTLVRNSFLSQATNFPFVEIKIGKSSVILCIIK